MFWEMLFQSCFIFLSLDLFPMVPSAHSAHKESREMLSEAVPWFIPKAESL